MLKSDMKTCPSVKEPFFLG